MVYLVGKLSSMNFQAHVASDRMSHDAVESVLVSAHTDVQAGPEATLSGLGTEVVHSVTGPCAVCGAQENKWKWPGKFPTRPRS